MRYTFIFCLLSLAACGSQATGHNTYPASASEPVDAVSPPAAQATPSPDTTPSPSVSPETTPEPTPTPTPTPAPSPTPTPTPTPPYVGIYTINTGTLAQDNCMGQCPASNSDVAVLWVAYSDGSVDSPPAGYSVVHSEHSPAQTVSEPATVVDGSLSWYLNTTPPINLCGGDTEQDNYRLTMASGVPSIAKTTYTVGQCHGVQRLCLCTYGFATKIIP